MPSGFSSALLPLIFRSFYFSALVLRERFCALYGISTLYDISRRLCGHIRDRGLFGAASWIDDCTREAISGSRQTTIEVWPQYMEHRGLTDR